MFKKLLPWYLLALVVLSLAFIYGCGNATGGGGGGGGGSSGGVVTNYTITGNLPQMAETDTLSIKVIDLATVTSICAIGADGGTYTATVSSDGSFSLGLVKGVPYVLGFYSGTNGTTLEGYLVVPSLGWNSLPIMDPTGESVNLGTLTVEAGSPLVTCEINASDLADFMQMNSSTANFYGAIDDAMVNMLNVDVNKDGIPDYLQDKSCYLTIYENAGPGIDPATGQISKMLTGFNDTYVPSPYDYMYVLCGRDKQVTNHTLAKLTSPGSSWKDWDSADFDTMTAEAGWTGNNYAWFCLFRSKDTGEHATLPAIPPSGTYVATVDTTTYTFDNCSFAGAYTLEATDNIIYPVFHLNTNEAGIITSVDYKWMKSVGGGSSMAADPDEVKAAVGNYMYGTAIANQSPYIQFGHDSGTSSCPSYTIWFDRDGNGDGTGTLDLSTATNDGKKIPPIKLSDVDQIAPAYVSSTNVQMEFWYR